MHMNEHDRFTDDIPTFFMFSHKDIWPPTYEILSSMASIKPNVNSPAPYATPTEIYRGSHPPWQRLQVQLRVASEPAQAGLLKILSNKFINYMSDVKNAEPFSIAWVSSASATATYDYLASRTTDVAITHHVAADNIAIKQGVADKSVYAWKDSWLLVGPKSNPADLSTAESTSVQEQFTQLYLAAVETTGSARPVRFLSRFDKSAANVKESSLWAAIGQVPWAHPHASWYQQYQGSPVEALKAAAALKQYTLTERQTWNSMDQSVKDELAVFSKNDDAEEEILSNPAHALVGRHAEGKKLANEFTAWLASPSGGQGIVNDFVIGKERSFSNAFEKRVAEPLTPPSTPPEFGRRWFR